MERISQSFMKDMRSYIDGQECGNIIIEKYVKGKLLDDSSDAMKLGSYYEYILSGALPKDKKVPKAEYKVSVINAKRKTEKFKSSTDAEIIATLTLDDMYEEYKRAHLNAERVKGYFEKWGFKIIEAGKKYTKGRHEGHIDLICEATKTIKFKEGDHEFVIKKGTRFVIDLKYSGLIEDKRSKHGWSWTPEQKLYHGTQAKEYNFLTSLPVFFLVCSSTNDIDIKFFRTILDEFSIEQHLAEGNFLHEKFNFFKDVGFKPRPEISRCSECAIREACKDKHTFPHTESVDLTISE